MLLIVILAGLWILYIILCIVWFTVQGMMYFAIFFGMVSYFSWERLDDHKTTGSYIYALAGLVALAFILHFAIKIIFYP
jgi:hypothetical protein